MTVNTRSINRAIKHLGLEIANNRDGYSYFLSLATGDQVGDSVMVCYMNQQTIAQWVKDAEWAVTKPRMPIMQEQR